MQINDGAHPDLARFAERQELRQLERMARRLRVAQNAVASEALPRNALSWLVLAVALAGEPKAT